LLIQQLAEVVRMPPTRLGELLGSSDSAEPQRPDPASAGRLRIPPGPIAGRGNLVRQAISLLVHHPTAGTGVGDVEALAQVDRPGIPLLVELLAQLREDPPANTGALLERWRDRPEHGPLSKLAVGECLVADAESAASEVRSAVARLIAEHSPAQRLEALLAKAQDQALDDQEKAELQGLLRARGQSTRSAPTK
jgi:DNA primase